MRSKVLQNDLLEQSAIRSTLIKLPFVFKTFDYFDWPLKTGFNVFIQIQAVFVFMLMFIFLLSITDTSHIFAQIFTGISRPFNRGIYDGPKQNPGYISLDHVPAYRQTVCH